MALPQWLLNMISMLDQMLQEILAAEADTRHQAHRAGCDPGGDPECLCLDSAKAQVQALRLTLQCHAALCEQQYAIRQQGRQRGEPGRQQEQKGPKQEQQEQQQEEEQGGKGSSHGKGQHGSHGEGKK